MATSPRDELRIVTITSFTHSENDGQWYWSTKAANGEVVGGSMGEGYKELRSAVAGFIVQQGYSNDVLRALGDDSPFNKLIPTGSGLDLRRYAYGAPDPYDPDHPTAMARKGWIPVKSNE